MLTEKNLYRMDSAYSKQHWYDADGIYTFIKDNNHPMQPFGRDCDWYNIKTKEVISIWDRTMIKISKEDARNIKISLITDEI